MHKNVVASVALLICASCSKTSSKADKRDPAAPPVETESHEFAGIRFAVPKGSKVATSDQNTPNMPATEVSGNGYRVTISKLPLSISFASYKEAVEMDPSGSKIVGAETARGWEIKHHSTIAMNVGGRTIYEQYLQLGSEQYLCRYDDDETSTEVAIADAICKSLDASGWK